MKTKTIFLTAALLGCFIGSAAQDVTVLHMKDGTTKRYMNGVKWKTSMEFYEHTPAATVTSPSYGSTTHENGYQYDWGVTQVLKLDGDYLVGLFWQDEVPENFQAQHGVCFGTEPGLTVDNCQEKMYYSKGANVTFSSVSDMNRSHYMWIGPRKSGNLRMSIDNYRWLESRDTLNYINIPLEIGQTYYYRTFSEGMINEAGQEKTVVFTQLEEKVQPLYRHILLKSKPTVLCLIPRHRRPTGGLCHTAAELVGVNLTLLQIEEEIFLTVSTHVVIGINACLAEAAESLSRVLYEHHAAHVE